MALGILLIMFVSVSVISVLGVLIMFLSKSTKVKKLHFTLCRFGEWFWRF